MLDRKKVQDSLDHDVFSENPFDHKMKAEMIQAIRKHQANKKSPRKSLKPIKPLVSVCLLAVVAACMFFFVWSPGQRNHVTSPADFTTSLLHYKKVKNELGDTLFKKIEEQYATKPAIQNTPWKVSPSFDLYDKNGNPVWNDPHHVQGIKNKVAFINTETIHAKSRRDVAKVLWLLWGNPDQLAGKKLTAFAVHKKTGETFLLNQVQLSGPGYGYGVDATGITGWSPFPEKGLWRIDVFIGGNYFDSIVVKVTGSYIQTKNATFFWSEDGLKAKETYHVTLEVNGTPKKKTINVKTIYTKNPSHSSTFSFRRVDTFIKTDGKNVTDYSGVLFFDHPGKWKITVLGETTVVNVNATSNKRPIQLHGKEVATISVFKVGSNIKDLVKWAVYKGDHPKALRSFTTAVKNGKEVKGIVDMVKPDYVFTIEFKDHTREKYGLWIGSKGGIIQQEKPNGTTSRAKELTANLSKQLNQYIPTVPVKP